MGLFKDIKTRLDQETDIVLTYNMKSSQRIESIQFLDSDTPASFDVYTLYLGDYNTFKHLAGKCILLLHHCPKELLAMSPSTDFTIYADDVSPMHIANILQQSLLESHMLNMKKEEVFHVLRSGYGIQRILDTARTYLENPITVCSSSFSIIAVSPSTDTHINITTHKMKRYLTKQALTNMQTEHVLEQIQNTHKPFCFRFPDDPDSEYLFCGIRIRHSIVGYVCIRSQIRSFCESDYPFVLELSHFIAVEMQKQDFFGSESGQNNDYFLSDLLEENLDDETFIRERMEQLGQRAFANHWIIAFAMDRNNLCKMNPSYYVYQVQQIFHNNMVFFYKGLVVMLYTCSIPVPFSDIDSTKLDYFLEYNHMHMAVSYRFEKLIHAKRYYDQVLFMCNQEHLIEYTKKIDYETSYLQHLIQGSAPEIHSSSLIHPDIKFLQKYDLENHTEYLHTLMAYFQCNRNALKAANFLHIHKSTFFYRLGKISELTAFDLENANLLFAYEFSVKLIDCK